MSKRILVMEDEKDNRQIIRDLLEQVLTNFCQQVARAVRLGHVVITSRCSRYMFFPIQRM